MVAEKIGSIVKLPDARIAVNLKAVFVTAHDCRLQPMPRDFCEAYSVVLNYQEIGDMDQV